MTVSEVSFVFSESMRYLRRRIISEIAGSPLKQRAVAFALLLKERTHDSSVVRGFTVAKVQRLTVCCHGGKESRMAYKTIRKYLSVLESMGLVRFVGGDLFLSRMTSSSKHRNVDISAFTLDRTKNIYSQLRDLLFLIIQAHKDFVKSLLRLRQSPSYGTDFKKVRRLCKRCCCDPNAGYEERGLSYKRIARQLGCCVRTAYTVVSDSILRRWCTKENRCEVHHLEGVNFREVPPYTFTTRNYGIILRANTYTLSRVWVRALCTDARENRLVHSL